MQDDPTDRHERIDPDETSAADTGAPVPPPPPPEGVPAPEAQVRPDAHVHQAGDVRVDPHAATAADRSHVEGPSSSGGGVKAGCIGALVALIIASIVGLAAGFAGAWLVVEDRVAAPGADGTDGAAEERTVRVVEGETEEVVAAAAAAALPSVVNIDVTSGGEDGDGDLPEGHPGVPVVGNGSGVAYRSLDGSGTIIITNHHVIADASEIVVTDTNGDRYDAEIVGSDQNTDIGVLRITGDVEPVELGESDELVVGQLVVAIGSPFGLQQSVTSGVVSAIGRSLPDSVGEEPGVYPLVDVIQTDAAINPGNSGGALVDRTGKLVGINTAIFSENGASAGIGFAVPADIVQRVADEIIETGEAKAPFLGIIGQTVSPFVADEEGLGVEEGALIVEITEGTGAAESDLRPGDVIVSFDDESIRSMDDLILAVRQSEVGDTVTVGIVRDGSEMDVEVEVTAKPDELEL